MTAIIESKLFEKSKITVVYIPGYNNTQSDPTLVALIAAYLKNGTYNIIALDWTRAAGAPYYPVAVLNAQMVAHVYCTIQTSMNSHSY